MSKLISEIHVLGPVSHPKQVVQNIVETVEGRVLILDLSSGQLKTPHTLREQIVADGELPEHIEWEDGQRYADICAEASRQEYVRWVAEQASKDVFEGLSVKEVFTYKDEISLWWFTSIAEKNTCPLRWLFYMMHVLDQIRQKITSTKVCKIWVTEKRMAKALKVRCPQDANVRIHYSDRRREGESVAWIGKVRRTIGSIYFLLRQSAKLISDKVINLYIRNKKRIDWMGGESPTILVQTYFPHSWSTTNSDRYGRDIEQLDRYFGVAPWEFRDRGYDVAWMPTLRNWQERNKWERLMRQNSLPEISSQMVLSWRSTLKILYKAWQWMGLYLWHFEIASAKWKLTYQDSSLGAYVRESVREAIQGAVSTLREIEEYRAVEWEIDPDAVLYRNEFYTGGRCVSAAFGDTTTLIGVQHGLIGNEHTVYHFHSSEIDAPTSTQTDYISNCPIPDYFASFGRRFVDMFENWGGYPAERVWAVGSLRHDSLMGQYRGRLGTDEKKNLRSRLQLPNDVPVALLCTGHRIQVASWSSMLFEAIQMLDRDFFLAVKLHPYHGGKTQVQSAAASAEFDSYRVYRKQIYSLLSASDVVIGGESTVLLEAGLFGTPTVSLEPPTTYRHYDFGELAESVSTVEELSQVLKSVLENGWKPKNVSAHLRNVEGVKATKHLLDHMPISDEKKG